MTVFKLSPSDLTFLYDQCKHCFVLKVKYGITQPSIPIPGIFSIIASLQKDYYSNMRTEAFCPELPPGLVTHGEKWVRSKPIKIDGCDSSFYINGRFDIVATFDDGSFGILDFKTGKSDEEKTKMYSRQLHAYSLALENPENGALQLTPISKLGLLYFSPDKCELISLQRQVLLGNMAWVEIPQDKDLFNSFLKEIILLLDGPLPPTNPEKCNWCAFLKKAIKFRNRGAQIELEKTPEVRLPNCPKCGGSMNIKKGKFGEFWSCLQYPKCSGTRDL